METVAATIKKTINDNTPRTYGIVFAVFLLISLIMEMFVFNYKWINSVFEKPVQAEQAVAGSEIRYDDLNIKLKYIYIDPGKGNIAHITISAVDEANANGLSAPERVVSGDVKPTQYIRLHFSGNIKDLIIRSDTDLREITLNSRVPLMFSWIRFILFALILMLLYVLRPGSDIYGYKADLTKRNQRLIAAALIAVQALTLFYMLHWNTDVLGWHKSYDHHRQYYELVDSFKQGHLYVDENNGTLSEMENPYDINERVRVNAGGKWDHAFYKGKYYIYFGVVPALLMYLPYNILTGQDLPNYIAVYILSILTMIGIALLLWEVIKKWFKNTPFVVYLILSVVYGVISLFGYAVLKPDFYLVPSAAALMFGVFGLAFWLSAERSDKKGELMLVKSRLAAGSVCIALTAGCRPQMTISVLLGVMLLWDAAFKKRLLFSRDSIKASTAVCCPFVIVAAGLMWYNAARFGSPFDFGANYNLTLNDMTHRGWVWGRSGLGLFSYLFQPFRFGAVFPFLSDFQAETTYQGLTLTEKMVGGVFWLFPILVPGLYGAVSRKLFYDKRIYLLTIMPVCMAAVIAIVDAQMAGLLTRYFTDFVWLLMLASSVTIFALLDRYKENQKPILRLIVGLSAVSVILAFLRIFAHSEDSIVSANPVLYYSIERLIAFWM